MQLESIEFSFLSIFTLITFFIFLTISKYSYKIKNGILFDKDFSGIFNYDKIKKFILEVS